MCDPFNTSTEAALRDKREDLDPFMAEHYATNAQHELDNALSASPPDQQRIAHIRRLLGNYHALAALAQLPDDSDFEDKEVVGSEDTAFIHPDRAARMRSGDGESVSLSSPPRGRSMFTNSRNDDVAGDEGF
jgi:predicted secreted protein